MKQDTEMKTDRCHLEYLKLVNLTITLISKESTNTLERILLGMDKTFSYCKHLHWQQY